ncbi:MAG: autotransporter domain-containing protein [Proteobacteria bacterium]|nr:autotransporter domain-containing protein [Pseudomonadota bacterium]
MRRLLACSCLTPILFIPAALHAETTVDAKRTTGVATSTIKNGARDDIRITSGGSIELTGGTAVALDTANTVKNEGTISLKDANDATGILATALSGEINNSGKITIGETYAGADDDKDGDADGPFSKQARNAGIKTAGAFTGSVTNSGAISVKGNDSTGIVLGGALTGNLTHSGTVDVLGDNSTGIRTQAVSGSVKVLGSVSAQGANAVGVSIEGPIGGALQIQSTVTSTGYRNASPPADVSKLDADDLLQGGPALRVAGSVGGGILFDVRPKDADPKDNDEDKDGIDDAKEGNASVSSFGAAPAVLVGSTTGPVTIGQVGTSGFGIVLLGEAVGSGQYKGVDGTGMQIGGTGGTVTVGGGVSVGGSLSAKSLDANATALRIGAGASVPKLQVAGTINATNGGGATTEARAVSIESGGSLPSITNTGTISATATGDAMATAIRDRSNTLTLIENTGAILASSKKMAVESAVAIDLTGNTVGTTVRQNIVAATATAPKITGAVLFGSGNDVFEVNDGSVIGAVRFGAGNNRLSLTGDAVVQGDVSFGAGADTLTLAGTSSLTGAVDFGGGADTLTIGGTAKVSGKLANTGGLAVTMTGGTLDARNAGAVALASLNVTGDSTIGVTIDPATKSATQYQAATASFGQGAKIAVSVASVGSAEGDYVVVKAGALTGGANLTANTSLPYMFKGTVSANDAAGQVSLKVARKSVAELGLSRSQAAAYDAVFNALDKDAKVAGVFLGIRDQGGFQDAVQQMLPDHAGGVFETVTRGSRTLGGYIADPNAMVADIGGNVGFWLQQAAWGTSKGRGDSAGYRSTGWGASGGLELDSGIGKFGASLAYLNGKAEQRRVEHQVDADQYEAAVHWRNSWGGFNAFARASAAYVTFSGSRRFEGMFGTEKVTRTATGDWNGQLYSAAGGLSYEFRTGRLTLRPGATVDYYRLHEDKHAEKGGGDAFNLNVAARTSDELAVTGTVAAGYDLTKSDTSFTRIELEGGRREIVGGSLGKTVASFKGGQSFTLIADEREAGWLGKLKLIGGNEAFRAGGEASVQQQNGRAALGFRATVSVGF